MKRFPILILAIMIFCRVGNTQGQEMMKNPGETKPKGEIPAVQTDSKAAPSISDQKSGTLKPQGEPAPAKASPPSADPQKPDTTGRERSNSPPVVSAGQKQPASNPANGKQPKPRQSAPGTVTRGTPDVGPATQPPPGRAQNSGDHGSITGKADQPEPVKPPKHPRF